MGVLLPSQRMLILTDHRTHSRHNALYALVRELRKDPRCSGIDLASRGLSINRSFFEDFQEEQLWVTPVQSSFRFFRDARCFRSGLRPARLSDYTVVFLRLPHPVANGFWSFLESAMPEVPFINRPQGVCITSDKSFLLQVPELCPPMRLCRVPEDVDQFSRRHPIVLKPLQAHGGKGILKVTDRQVWSGNQAVDLDTFYAQWEKDPIPYLGMQYMENVSRGDKRIVVVNGQVLGAALRHPLPGSWMCNIAQGGSASSANLTPEEYQMAERLTPILRKHGILFYGFDTLENKAGKRRLSEINTLSIGGLPQIANFTGEPLVERAARLIWDYIKQHQYGKPLATA